MDKNVCEIMKKRMEKTADALRKNNMEVYLADDCGEAVKIVKSLLKKGETISCGGSESLKESGILELMQSGDYDFLDRSKAKNREETEEIYRKTFFADTFLTSANAVTENGEIYNVDGNSNRVASIVFGPKSVIIIAGKNKIVNDFDEAVKRVKEIAAPKNAKRLSCETYCNIKEKCVSLNNENADVCNGCASNSRICCNYVLSSYQKVKDRIKVIIVDEELGY